MNNTEFYGTISLITDHINTVALININEFLKLQRINGEYKWIPFKIGSMPAIPILTSSFKERFKATSEMVNIQITPVWKFLTNNETVITPNIETFELTEYTSKNPHYTLKRKINPNPHYLANTTWHNLFDKSLATKQNAVEWNKSCRSTLLAKVDENILKTYLNIYQDELEQFNQIYQQSAQTAKELRTIYQKKLK